MNLGTTVILFLLLVFVTCSSNDLKHLCNDEYASIVDCFWDERIRSNMNTPSYILESSRFMDNCALSNMTRIIKCYNNVIDNCPNYRDSGPFLMSKEAFQAFFIGTCLNKDVYEDGMACIGQRINLWNYYANKDCITRELQNGVWDAYIQYADWTWDKYCSLMDNGIECSAKKALEYGCSTDFYDFLVHSAYVRIPVECHEPNNEKYQWLYLYKELPMTLERNETNVQSSSLTVTASIVLILTCIANSLFPSTN